MGRGSVPKLLTSKESDCNFEDPAECGVRLERGAFGAKVAGSNSCKVREYDGI